MTSKAENGERSNVRIDVLTLFPEMFEPVLNGSILGRAQKNGLLDFSLHNIRDYADNKHRACDDYPYGGGAGMVMMAQPIMDCIRLVTQGCEPFPRRIYLSPRGKTLDAQMAQRLSREEHLLLLCGHYEGIDERILTEIDEQISIGDYVLTGGELPAMVLIDCISRFIPGVLGHEDSAYDESFSGGLLEYPHYTRPAEYRGMNVPDVLLSGHHAKIVQWRHEQALRLTCLHRPDLLEDAALGDGDMRQVKAWRDQNRD